MEKYLKCILFIRRIPATRLHHDLQPAVDLCQSNAVGLDLTERSKQFVARIDSMGRYRYMEASLWVDWGWIVSLDQAVWELRRFCTLDPKATSPKLVEGGWAPRVRIVGGHLEKILNKRDNPARAPLLWHNGYFGRARRSVKVNGGMYAINSPLFQRADLLDDVLKFAHIPKKVVNAYREHSQKEMKAARKR